MRKNARSWAVLAVALAVSAQLSAQDSSPAKPTEPKSTAGAKENGGVRTKGTAPESEEEGVATGVGTHFVSTNTPLVNDQGVFEAIITHRFVTPVREAGGQRAFGLDTGASIGLGMDYTFVKNLAVQVYRQSVDADYEFALKGTILRPTAVFPVAVGARFGIDWQTADYIPQKYATPFGQLLLSVTLGDRVTLSAAPSWASRTPTGHHAWNVPVAAQIKVTNSISAIAEYIFARASRNGDPAETVGQWSFAIEKAVYHHRFALVIGNTSATNVDEMIGGDFVGGSITESNIRLGFNIVRQFDIATK
ncbi:MAG: DUF5777 family beta-barrel protein [Thermoanaerobaculia bacterium]